MSCYFKLNPEAAWLLRDFLMLYLYYQMYHLGFCYFSESICNIKQSYVTK